MEWKESWHDEYLKWICGFANAKGGRLVIGMGDDGSVVGLPNARKLLEDLPNKIRDLLGIMVAVNLKTSGGRDYLELDVEAYPAPVSLRGRYYFRSGSTKQELKGAALDKFLLQKQGRHWDGVPVPFLKAEDLSKEALDGFRLRAAESKRMEAADLVGSGELLVERLKLQEGDYLKKAAILLFYPDPEKFVTGAFLKIGFFRTDSDLRFQDEVHGDLFSQVGKALDFLLTKYTEATISYRGAQRVERYPVPAEALREALHNAVVHKDYSSGAPVQIRVYTDKITIWNPGGLPVDWSIDQLLEKHASHPFNPDIANVFFRAGMIEAWGRGIEMIMDSCQAAGLPRPKIRGDAGGICVELPFAPAELPAEVECAPVNDPKGSALEATQETTQETTQEKIVAILKENPETTRNELASRIGITPDGIKYHLTKLRVAGLIRHVGPTKAGRWEVMEDDG